MAPSNVHLVKVTDPTIACGNRDVFELNVHVVFRCVHHVSRNCAGFICRDCAQDVRSSLLGKMIGVATFNELAAVNLARGDFQGNDMILQFIH